MTSVLMYFDALESSVSSAKYQLSKEISNFFIGIVDSGFFLPNILKVIKNTLTLILSKRYETIIAGINFYK